MRDDEPDDSGNDAAIDPGAGVVLGLPWGANARECTEHAAGGVVRVEARPEGEVLRLVRPVELAGHALRATLELELERLVAVRLTSAALALAEDAVAGPLLRAVGRWFGRDAVEIDEAFWEVARGPTRLTIDLLDGALVFEEHLAEDAGD